MPERTAYWPADHTLLAADIHLGKAATFRAAGIPMPLGESQHSLDRLTSALRRTDAKRLLLLGDLWHAREGMTEGTLDEFEDWLRSFSQVEIVLIRGNHDRRVGQLSRQLPLKEVSDSLVEGPFHFCHHPCQGDGYVICGHIHPAVRLTGTGRQSHTLPCFWFGRTNGVLPAVGTFTGVEIVRPSEQDQVFVVHSDQVVKVTHGLARRGRTLG